MFRVRVGRKSSTKDYRHRHFILNSKKKRKRPNRKPKVFDEDKIIDRGQIMTHICVLLNLIDDDGLKISFSSEIFSTYFVIHRQPMAVCQQMMRSPFDYDRQTID